LARSVPPQRFSDGFQTRARLGNWYNFSMSRIILCLDLDAFYASVEELLHPEWRGLPLLVGGRPDERGVVSSCSYAARKFGIHSAMPMAQALRLARRRSVLRRISRSIRIIRIA